MPTFSVKFQPADSRRKGEEVQVSAESAPDAITVYANQNERTPGETAKGDKFERYLVAPIGTAAREIEYHVTSDGSIAPIPPAEDEDARAHLPTEQTELPEPADSEDERNRAAEERARHAEPADEGEPDVEDDDTPDPA